MTTVVEPDAQVFWRSSGAVSDSGGTRDLTPNTAEGWAAAQSSAATVAETGNLLMMPLYSRGRGPDWIRFAQDLVRAGTQAEGAAIDRDGAAMFGAGARLSEACSACHQAYLPREQAAKADSTWPARRRTMSRWESARARVGAPVFSDIVNLSRFPPLLPQAILG